MQQRIRRLTVIATTPTGTAITIYAYRPDTAPASEPPVLVTAAGERVEWRARGVYYVPDHDLILTSDDPAAP